MQLVVILCDINSINQLESATLQNITKMKINLADQEFLSQCHLKTSILRIIFNSLCLYQESIALKFLERLAEWCKNIKISDPLEEGCRLGPVVSQGQVHIYAFLFLFSFISRRGFSINKFIKTLRHHTQITIVIPVNVIVSMKQSRQMSGEGRQRLIKIPPSPPWKYFRIVVLCSPKTLALSWVWVGKVEFTTKFKPVPLV